MAKKNIADLQFEYDLLAEQTAALAKKMKLASGGNIDPFNPDLRKLLAEKREASLALIAAKRAKEQEEKKQRKALSPTPT